MSENRTQFGPMLEKLRHQAVSLFERQLTVVLSPGIEVPATTTEVTRRVMRDLLEAITVYQAQDLGDLIAETTPLANDWLVEPWESYFRGLGTTLDEDGIRALARAAAVVNGYLIEDVDRVVESERRWRSVN